MESPRAKSFTAYYLQTSQCVLAELFEYNKACGLSQHHACSTQKFHARTPQPQRSTNVVYRPVGVLGQCEGYKLDFALSSELYHLRALNKLERETTLNLSLLLTWSKVIRK